MVLTLTASPRATPVLLSTSFDLETYGKLTEMILFATQGFSLRDEDFQTLPK